MAPPRPPPTSTKRMTANPTKPARYRPGKPTADTRSSSSSSPEPGSDVELDDNETTAPPPPPKASSFPADGAKRIAQTLKNVDLAARRREGEARERARRDAERAGRERMEAEAGFETESEEEEEEDEERKIDDVARMGDGGVRVKRPGGAESDEDEDEDEDEEEDDSSEEESSSEDEKPKFQRPVFVPKLQRGAASAPSVQTHTLPSSDDPSRQHRTDALVQAKLDQAAAARAAGRKEWDDDDTADAEAIDDTDGLDPELERQQWVARELGRLKRARVQLEEREAQLEEVERRRGLTAEERAREDEEKIARQAEEREGKGKAGFMARYHHRGAFFREEAEKEGLLGRDLMGARFVDESTRGKDVLPEYLQVRDATKIGRKGRTRYKDLRSEDTGKWGDFGERRPRGEGRGAEFVEDERFRPDWQGGSRREGVTGANASSLGERKRAGEEREGHMKKPRVDDR